MVKKKAAPLEVECDACNGTGFPPAIQSTRPGRRIYPQPCTVCGGRGHIWIWRAKRTRYVQGALTRKFMDVAQQYLEVQRLRLEVQKVERELEERRKAEQRNHSKKR